MKVLLDHNLPRQLKPYLGEQVYTARELGWDGISNGNLIAAAEADRFDVMITGDQNLTYQQNASKRTLAIIVLTEINRKVLAGHEHLIRSAISRVRRGSYEVVHIPSDTRKPQR